MSVFFILQLDGDDRSDEEEADRSDEEEEGRDPPKEENPRLDHTSSCRPRGQASGPWPRRTLVDLDTKT